MNNIICNKCYDEVKYKTLLNKNNNYICELCNNNIIFYTRYNIKNYEKKKILKDKNNNNDCALKKCGKRVESFEKKSIIICCKCIFEYDKLNINNYSVSEPDVMCKLCNYSCCSSYNFHINCFDKFICTSCDSFK